MSTATLLRSLRVVTRPVVKKSATRSFHALKPGKNDSSDASKRKGKQISRRSSSPSPSSSVSKSSVPQSSPKIFRSSNTRTNTAKGHRVTPRQNLLLQQFRARQALQQRVASFQAERDQDASQWTEKLAEKQAMEAKEHKHQKMVQEMKQSMQADAVKRRQRDLEKRFAKRDGRWKQEIQSQYTKSEQPMGRRETWAKSFGKYAPRAVGTNVQSWTKEAQVHRITPVEQKKTTQAARPKSESTTEVTQTPSPSRPLPLKPKTATNSSGLPQLKEFYRPPPSLTQRKGKLSVVPSTGQSSQSSQESMSFNSPSLLPGLVSCLNDLLGPQASPTEIQRLSIARVVDPVNNTDFSAPETASDSEPPAYKEFLLASETGSGKSIAYLLPLLQSLKVSELTQQAQFHARPTSSSSAYAYNPRSLILAPTHELARQLAGFAKTLSHEIKLRVVCTSKANIGNSRNRERESDQRPIKELTVSDETQVTETEGEVIADGVTELNVLPLSRGPSADNFASSDLPTGSTSLARPVDVMVGTPMKFLEMIFGRGWDRINTSNASDINGASRRRIGKPEMGLSNIEWVIVDEADILFDPDFNSFTRLLLAEISKAKGKEVAFVKEDKVLSAECYPEALDVSSDIPEEGKVGNEGPDSTSKLETSHSPSTDVYTTSAAIMPTKYPFNLILTTATIPPALFLYLQQQHPALFARRRRLRNSRPNSGILRSSGLHRLPSSLKIEQVDWSGGNKLADIEKRLRAVWMEDERRWMGNMGKGQTELSKIIVFCNKSAKVDDLGAYLEEKGIKTVTLTSKISSSSGDTEAGEDKEVETAAEEEGKFEKIERRGSERRRGSNKHLEGFLRVRSRTKDPASATTIEEQSSSLSAPRRLQPLVVSSSKLPQTHTSKFNTTPTLSNTPHVLLTTSLLSRGLDFSPSVRHVFIVDEPRNVVDFLHRAGRTGRAGTEGVVVVFGKGGRSASKGKKGLPMEWRGGRS